MRINEAIHIAQQSLRGEEYTDDQKIKAYETIHKYKGVLNGIGAMFAICKENN